MSGVNLRPLVYHLFSAKLIHLFSAKMCQVFSAKLLHLFSAKMYHLAPGDETHIKERVTQGQRSEARFLTR
jgi:hypothetical protein